MKIDHVAMYVEDLEGARDFFVRYLGGSSNQGNHNPKTDFRSYFITFADGARLELMQKPAVRVEAQGEERTGYIHLAFSVGSKEEVDRLTAQLAKDGYATLSGPRTTGDGYYESCVRGFEGNLIELTI